MEFTPDFRSPVESTPLWRQLWQELRDRIHPAPEPDIHLESKPVPVKDIWSHDTNLRQRLSSIGIHLAKYRRFNA